MILRENLILFLCCVCIFPFLGIANSIVKPCDNMTSTTDESFLRANLYTMHSDIEEFFRNDVTKDCNLHYIDIHKIQPRKGSRSTWITYLGDSIAHDLYLAAVQRLTGFDHSANPEEVTKGTLGGHLGPQTEERINKLRYVNNPEYLMCCRAWYRPIGDGDKGKTNECLFAGAKKMAGMYIHLCCWILSLSFPSLFHFLPSLSLTLPTLISVL